MHICSFIATEEIKNAFELRSRLYDIVVNLINEEEVKRFYVGSGNEFCSVVYDVLDKIGEFYQEVGCYAILSGSDIPEDLAEKEYVNWACPEMVSRAPMDIAWRVRDFWLIDAADFVVVYGKKPKKLKAKRVILL